MERKKMFLKVLGTCLMVLFGLGALYGQTITVTSPAAGATWTQGSTQTITWTRTGVMDENVKIRLFDEAGENQVLRIVDSTPNNGSFRWTVPRDIPPGRYRIRVRTVDDRVMGNSGVFNIVASAGPTITVTSPAAGARVGRGGTLNIAWTTGGSVDRQVRIVLRDGASTRRIMDIADNVPTRDGRYSWTVPEDLAAGSYRIRVRTSDVIGESGVFDVFVVMRRIIPPQVRADYSIESLEIFDILGTPRNTWVNGQLLYPYNQAQTGGNVRVRVRWNRIPPPQNSRVSLVVEKRYLRDRPETWIHERTFTPIFFNAEGVYERDSPFSIRAGEPDNALVAIRARLVYHGGDPAPTSNPVSMSETLTLRQAHAPIDLAVQHFSGLVKIVYSRNWDRTMGRRLFTLTTRIRLRNVALMPSRPIPNVKVCLEIWRWCLDEKRFRTRTARQIFTVDPVPSDRWLERNVRINFDTPNEWWEETLFVVIVDPDEEIEDINRANNRFEYRFRTMR